MNWKMASFIFIPIIFFGCMAYSYKTSKNEKIIPGEILQNKIEIDEIHREFDGSKG